MSYKVFYTKDFNGCLRAIERNGRRDILRKVRAAMAEAQTTGAISDLSRTHHGESRLPNAEKYDLGSGHRLVVQLVDGVSKARAFLFAGDHEDAEHWLEGHKNYRWVENSRDRTIQFVQIAPSDEPIIAPSDRLDLSSPPSLLELPLLRMLTHEEWASLQLPSAVEAYLKTIKGLDYEQDADGILSHVAEIADYETSALAIDLLHHAHAKEFEELAQRVKLAAGEAVEPTPEETIELMTAAENAETIISFDDDIGIAELLNRSSLSDWMLFLHPEQKRVAYKDFTGPVRLRGVSGSGKTSVLVHRARFLARKYGLPVLVVTLTESMRKLLQALLADLCGVEQNLIDALTISQLAKQIIEYEHPRGLRDFLIARPDQLDAALRHAESQVKANADFQTSSFASWDRIEFRDFLREEIQYVRGRLLPRDYEKYGDARQFKRTGRGTALSEGGRKLCLIGVTAWDTFLTESKILDNEGIAALACKLIESPNHQFRRYRCVVADEVQDLSQVDVMVMARLAAPRGGALSDEENGLFLVGDGAQTIYRRGFRLRAAGIEVANRSFLLKKNYRNTFEILKAAFALIEQYEFADSDEDDFTAPSTPDYAKRRGEPPRLVKCRLPRDEAEFVAKNAASLIADGTPPSQICVVGANPMMREQVKVALDHRGLGSVELREDVQFEGERIKLSTIESAKGHEFACVFVVGLVEGVLPRIGTLEEELPREAARLYVAMTRARESLWMSYSYERNYSPSRFLVTIQPYCDEMTFDHGELSALTTPEEFFEGAS